MANINFLRVSFSLECSDCYHGNQCWHFLWNDSLLYPFLRQCLPALPEERVCLLWKCITGGQGDAQSVAVWTEGWSSKPGTSGMLKMCPLKSRFHEGGASGVARDFIIVKIVEKNSSRTVLSKNAHPRECMLRHQLFCLLPLLQQKFDPWPVKDERIPNGLVLAWRRTDVERVRGLTEDCRSGFPPLYQLLENSPLPHFLFLHPSSLWSEVS